MAIYAKQYCTIANEDRFFMNWNGLKVFLVISQTGSLAGAAKKLCVNHSTVFRRLNAFEEEIGGRLFERFSHRYELTSMGEEVQKLGKEIADSFDTIERHIVGKDFQPTGTIKVTAPINIACRYLPKYLTEFKQLYPDIDIELHAGNQAVNMANRQADIAVRASASPPEHLVGRQVSSIRWSIYASKAYQARFELPVTIS
ncbi:MAG: LysR family transcriptional regulator, partial [Methylococcales bacterium]|nr:LysR family transcriptional regulator [Methylococcales bacterium]